MHKEEKNNNNNNKIKMKMKWACIENVKLLKKNERDFFRKKMLCLICIVRNATDV